MTTPNPSLSVSPEPTKGEGGGFMRVMGALALCIGLVASACDTGAPVAGKHGTIRVLGFDESSVKDGCGDIYSVQLIGAGLSLSSRIEYTRLARVCDAMFKALP